MDKVIKFIKYKILRCKKHREVYVHGHGKPNCILVWDEKESIVMAEEILS